LRFCLWLPMLVRHMLMHSSVSTLARLANPKQPVDINGAMNTLTSLHPSPLAKGNAVHTTMTDFPWGRGIHAFSTLAIVVCTALPFASGEGCSEPHINAPTLRQMNASAYDELASATIDKIANRVYTSRGGGVFMLFPHWRSSCAPHYPSLAAKGAAR
jgi:hypothetical protein